MLFQFGVSQKDTPLIEIDKYELLPVLTPAVSTFHTLFAGTVKVVLFEVAVINFTSLNCKLP
jgi:hypothetical protein